MWQFEPRFDNFRNQNCTVHILIFQMRTFKRSINEFNGSPFSKYFMLVLFGAGSSPEIHCLDCCVFSMNSGVVLPTVMYQYRNSSGLQWNNLLTTHWIVHTAEFIVGYTVRKRGTHLAGIFWDTIFHEKLLTREICLWPQQVYVIWFVDHSRPYRGFRE